MRNTQLILYPQFAIGNNGFSFTSTQVQYLANSSFTSALQNSIQVSTSNPLGAAISTNASLIGNWQGFSTDSSVFAAASVPFVSSGNLNLPSSGSALSFSGVYQTVDNLTIGADYEIFIKHAPSITGFTIIGQNNFTHTNGSFAIGNGVSFTTVQTNTTFTFTATDTEQLLVITYAGSSGTTFQIQKITLKEVIPSAISNVEDGSVICDLYDNEAIPLSLSVDDFKNAAEKVQSHSKDFNLPATKRNNKIFSSIFDVQKSIDSNFDFNPYVRTRAVLKEDTYTIFEGTLRLIDIINKDGEISYNVNLFSEAVALSEVLKDKKINDLDLDELEHDYTITNVTNSWTGVLALTNALPSDTLAGTAGASTTAVLKYPFCNWDNNITENASGQLEIKLEQAFRPFIQCKYLIDKIFSEAGYTFESDFLSSTKFTKLFMDFNWGAGNAPHDTQHTGEGEQSSTQSITGTSYTKVNFQTHNFTNEFGYDGTNTFTASQNDTTYQVSCYMTISGTWNAQIFKNSTPVLGSGFSSATQGTSYSVSSLPITINATDTLSVQVQRGSGTVNITSARIIADLTLDNITTAVLLNNLRGDLGQFEFLKGIMTMFNLVTLQDKDNPNNLIIEPYKDVFIKPIHVLNTSTTVTPKQLNWTDKVDISEINLKPLDLVKTTNFSFEVDDDDYTHNVYKKSAGKNYGHYTFEKSEYTMLEGETEIKATPFSVTVVKPLLDFLPNFVTPSIFQANDDATEFESFDNAPRILFDNGVKSTGKTYAIPAKNGVAATTKTDFLQFSHLSEIPTTATTDDYNFGYCYLFNPLTPVVDNLYNTYWSTYYDDLYNVDTRVMTLRVNLTPADINTFRFFDTVLIKNKEYRVNKIDYKAGELANVEFILIP
tara:strand:- start:1372 stop:4026 length:2655 start_codon:yes stop_codon:yes gene_type:complete